MRHYNLLIVILFSFVHGCMPPKAAPVTDVSQSSEDYVVVIGKIELRPKFNPELEQETHWNVIGDEQYLNTILMATGPEPDPVSTSSPKFREWKNRIETQWGELFKVKLPKQRTYFRGGMVLLDSVKQEFLWFPGGYYFDVPEGASTVYIGTMEYFRNDFNSIENIRVFDEYDQAIAELGDGLDDPNKVTRSLLRPYR